MQWINLLNANRFKQETKNLNPVEIRSQFQRDYDRIIFAPSFRRLQNKTQVFPLPGSVYVHNRLTHSLEVASVGRSLGRKVANYLMSVEKNIPIQLLEEIPTIVSTACLCHDMGNPPFGHSGEDALSKYFREGAGQKLRKEFSEQQWFDLSYFEGNANALRLMTHQFRGRRQGGFVNTYATLASIIKYPYASTHSGGAKYGFFETEKDSFKEIMGQTGLHQKPDGTYSRHPLVFLVEAADDISYVLMDMEDAHRLNILSFEEMLTYLSPFYEEDELLMANFKKVQQEVSDKNEIIAFLRASIINKLINACADVFVSNYEDIMKGNFTDALYKHMPDHLMQNMKACKTMSVKRIYNHRSVVKIQLAGYHVLGTLLEEFINAIQNPGESYSQQLMSLIPAQFDVLNGSLYEKTRSVLDFISGMTDIYAVQLFRDIRGIDFEQWPV
ncbi:MAG: deoxyguanosinetriphosphate triphosphohydrolase [Salinivirgaceae bacterium]|nr:MAG: deoxyguanosinetriphosphate triphosphohydrolase [Salinivirgaceae bacterium]